MNRQIKFRGLRTDGKGWAYGAYVPSGVNPYDIIIDGNDEHAVIASSVGQFTGLTDKNGVEVFEGDYVSYYNRFSNKTYEGTVKWDDMWASFAIFEDGRTYAAETDWVKIDRLTVIRNIHEQ